MDEKNIVTLKEPFINVFELDHPLVTHKLTVLRNKHTGTKEFREIIEELCIPLCYAAFADAELEDVSIETPIAPMQTGKLNENKYVFVPILRAGTGMLSGMLKVVPNAKIAHIGMYRDEETFEPHEYFFKAPEGVATREAIILDPMLATGGSIGDTINKLKSLGVKKIKALCIIAAPEGLVKIQADHPDVKIYCAKIDEQLNEKKYIVPGLGDAGDRIFGTK